MSQNSGRSALRASVVFLLVTAATVAAVGTSNERASAEPAGAVAGTPRGAATALATGDAHGCAIVQGGQVRCWGSNDMGQLGQGHTNTIGDTHEEIGPPEPVDLGAGRTAVAITAGGFHTCAILDGGDVKCWGYNATGQLGQGDTQARGDSPNELGDNLPVLDLGTGRSAVAIAAGYANTCVVLDNGQVKCWGHSGFGQMGQGDTETRGDEPGEMGDNLPPIDLGTGRTATAISIHYIATCALLDDGSVKCWGHNSAGQLGQGHTDTIGDDPGEMGDNLPPIELGTGRTAKAVTAGSHHTCAILDDDSTVCWGSNLDGKLGVGSTVTIGDEPDEMGDNLVPVDLGSGRKATAITAARNHACALLDDDSVKCWGSGSAGVLGQGNTNSVGDGPGEMGDALSPIDLGNSAAVAAISADYDFNCALLSDGTIKCWGTNYGAELGLGHTEHMGDDPGEMGDLLPRVELGWTSAIVGGGAGPHTCAILEGGSLKCWGENSYGQLGQGHVSHLGNDAGEMGDALPPIDLGDGRIAMAVATGSYHTCALLDDGTVKCWGNNSSGQLGQGHTNDIGDDPNEMGESLPSVDLGDGRTAVSIAAANMRSCAVLDDHSVKCWGYNAAGQLGQGHTADIGDQPDEMGDALPPVDLGDGRTASFVSAGALHTCALLDDGSIKCWGFNDFGQLGQGHVSHLGNDAGEMGDALPPIDLGDGHTALSVSAGGHFACALLDDKSVKCWGRNTYGQLGQGDVATRGDGAGEMGSALLPVSLGTGRTTTSIAAGYSHVCVILDDLTIKCWGSNADGQLGQGHTNNLGDNPNEMGDDLAPIDLGTDQSPSRLVVGRFHSCAVAGRAARCWGQNSFGQLGLEDTSNVGNAPNEMGSNLAWTAPSGSTMVAELVGRPAAPAAASLVPAGHDSVFVEWSEPADSGGDDVTAYRVQRSSDGVVFTTIDQVTASALSYIDLDVEPDTTYWYRIAALNTVGQGPWTLAAQATTTGPPPPPPPTTEGPTEPDTNTEPAWTLCHDHQPVGYWLIEQDGTVYDFGDAFHQGSPDINPGTTAIDIEATPTGCGYWTLLTDGTIQHFGDAAPLPEFNLSTLTEDETLSSFAPTPTGQGLWGFTNRGRVLLTGDAQHKHAGSLVDLSNIELAGSIIDAKPTPTGDGYYMLGTDGGIFAFGDAVFVDSIPGLGITQLDQPAVGLVPDPDGNGYWIVAADGGVFAFSAPYRGSFPALGLGTLAQPVIGMTPYGNGYLQVATDGGIFNFSNLPFSGSLGNNPPDTPITALTPTW